MIISKFCINNSLLLYGQRERIFSHFAEGDLACFPKASPEFIGVGKGVSSKSLKLNANLSVRVPVSLGRMSTGIRF